MSTFVSLIKCAFEVGCASNIILQDPVARKFVLLVDFHGVGLGSLVPLTIVRDLMVIMQASLLQSFFMYKDQPKKNKVSRNIERKERRERKQGQKDSHTRRRVARKHFSSRRKSECELSGKCVVRSVKSSELR